MAFHLFFFQVANISVLYLLKRRRYVLLLIEIFFIFRKIDAYIMTNKINKKQNKSNLR